ncbi:MAG: hypothetical protein HOF74_13520 [Gammaproteobacteria bacterium]|jgi:hypothetical protein|nr:hypothetical protein [Gammaproteobacteria bacterium]MBT3860845.1 hypothetical protein [Gammaproteobacteria bacterium]MBT3986900.1 hypothetical protein [Gammaproteobacteria bacterium]MBT4255676.1 hypothetical protein [Gammaproteobacteria bacterium]MBT4582119.1 hypothetical protein [Gammaproteobacteria bacterium]
MKTTIFKKLILLIAVGVFSQFAMAQNEDNAAAIKQVADIVAGINHFPSDDALATLDGIAANGGLAQAIRDMANAAANIEHSANEEGRGAMEALQNNTQMPERGRVLAGIIENFSHTCSDADKERLAELFP